MSGAGLAGGVALGGVGMSGTASAASITAGASVWSDRTSANGWPVVPEPEARRVEGSDIDVTVLPGDVATVLLHVARRYYYEIDTLRKGEVSGHGTSREYRAAIRKQLPVRHRDRNPSGFLSGRDQGRILSS
jgi:hypothetical protein